MAQLDDPVMGVSKSLVGGEWNWPVHGLRHPAEKGTTGWYVWTGELLDDPDFFVPLHADHLISKCPLVAKYLDLPPGSRFLIAPDHEDVWHDPSLLET